MFHKNVNYIWIYLRRPNFYGNDHCSVLEGTVELLYGFGFVSLVLVVWVIAVP